MPKKPKYRPNRHQEPLFDWDFTVMEILREKPEQGSPSPLVSPINGSLDEDAGTATHDNSESFHINETEKPRYNQSLNDNLLDVSKLSLDNVPVEVLDFLKCLTESNSSLRQEVKRLKEENTFQRQFSERLQQSNNECVEMISDLQERVSLLQSRVSDHGRADGDEGSFKYLQELREKRDECAQLREDLNRFDGALKESKVKASLLDCDVDFYKNEMERLKKTIQELEAAQNKTSSEPKTSCLAQNVPQKPTQHPEQSLTIFFVPSLKGPSAPPVEATSTQSKGAATPSPPEPSVKSPSEPSVNTPRTESTFLKSAFGPSSVLRTTKAKLDAKSFAPIPKLDLSGMNNLNTGWTEPIRCRERQSLPRTKGSHSLPINASPSLPKPLVMSNLDQRGAEWTEPLRTRDIESPPRPKAPKFAKSLNFESKGNNPTTTPIIAPGNKGKLKSTHSTPIFPPINVRPDEKIHQPKIIQRRKPEDITNTCGINRRGLILPDINLLSSDKTKMKTSGPSSCVVLPTRPSLTNKKEEKHVGQKKGVQDTGRKRNFRF